MIKLFGKTDKNFASNGDIVLQPVTYSPTSTGGGRVHIEIGDGQHGNYK